MRLLTQGLHSNNSALKSVVSTPVGATCSRARAERGSAGPAAYAAAATRRILTAIALAIAHLYEPLMCTLAIYFQVSARHPLVIAANRDEFLERPSLPPTVAAGPPWVACGADVVAGGTWLGLNHHQLVAGILNRRTGVPPDPECRSRGLLCREALDCATAAAACDRVL